MERPALGSEWSDVSTLSGLYYELRPHQWYKQLLLFIPLIYSGQAMSLTAWGYIVAGAFSFSLAAGCVYIINDIFDREEDRKHPVKRHRPIASGQVSVKTAGFVAVAVFFLAGSIAFWLDNLFFLVVLAYLGQNFAYSTVLKHIFLVDMFVLGAGFVLRAVAGVVLISAPLSPWLFLTVFLAAFLLASGKRHAELITKADAEIRASLGNFTAEFSVFLLFLSAATLLVVYSLYTFFVHQSQMMFTIPFSYYSVLRFCHLTLEQPTERIHQHIFRRDMLWNFVLWGVITLIVLYRPISL